MPRRLRTACSRGGAELAGQPRFQEVRGAVEKVCSFAPRARFMAGLGGFLGVSLMLVPTRCDRSPLGRGPPSDPTHDERDDRASAHIKRVKAGSVVDRIREQALRFEKGSDGRYKIAYCTPSARTRLARPTSRRRELSRLGARVTLVLALTGVTAGGRRRREERRRRQGPSKPA